MVDIEVAFWEVPGGPAVVFCVPCDIHLCIYGSLDVCLVQARSSKPGFAPARKAPRAHTMTATADQHGAEQYEITEDGRLFGNAQPLRFVKYPDGSTIDWLQQDAAERERNQALRSQAGVRGVLSPILEATRMWLVVIVTGIGIGLTGAWLDILVKWCAISFCYCCTGY